MTPSPVVTTRHKARKSMIEKSSNNENKIAINLAKSINLLEIGGQPSNSNDARMTAPTTSGSATTTNPSTFEASTTLTVATSTTQSTRSTQSTRPTQSAQSTRSTSETTNSTTASATPVTSSQQTENITARNQRELQNLNQSNIIEGKRTRAGR